MLKHIQRLYFNDKNSRLLWSELIIFSIIFGIAFRSWSVFGVMFLGSFWLLTRPRGTVHMIMLLK